MSLVNGQSHFEPCLTIAAFSPFVVGIFLMPPDIYGNKYSYTHTLIKRVYPSLKNSYMPKYILVIFLNHLLIFRCLWLSCPGRCKICLELAASYPIRRACFHFQFVYFLVWRVIDRFLLVIFQPKINNGFNMD